MVTKEQCEQALRNLETINLDIVLEELGYEKAEKVSWYGMNDYPTLEKQGDIDVLRELIEEHFDNPPLELNDLEIEKPYWDNEEKEWCFFVKLHKDIGTGVKISVSVVPMMCAFQYKENRFYRKEVQE